MDDRIRWGVVAPTFDQFGTGALPPLVAAARRAEELGFDALWVGDHLACPAPGLDALCALSAAAAVTDRVELGLSVLQLGLRHPVWAAKQLATVDALAPGRLRLGVGVGGEFEDEFVAVGADRHSRGQRLDEMLDILPALLRGEPIDHHGRHANFRVPGLLPAPATLPPLSVGGRSDAALVRTARYADQWIAMWHSPDTVRECADKMAGLAADQGRPEPSTAMLVIVNVSEDVDAARREVSASLHGMYRLPLRVVDRWTGYGPAEQVAKLLVDYRDAGVGEFLLLPAAPDPIEQFDRLTEVRELVSG
jgi:probable F420-dependent oxidoreductase